MHHYTQGKPTRQGHKGIPEGCYEEEQGLKGFFGPVSHLIKPAASTRWKSIEGPLKPRMYDLIKLEAQPHWQRLLYNQHVGIYMAWMNVAQVKNPIGHRNADGDTLFFCHQGKGSVLTEYGMLTYAPGTYVVVPKCLTYTILPEEKSVFFVVENKTSHYEEPDRGIVGRHAIYDINAIGKPDLESQHEKVKKENLNVVEVHVKREEQVTRFEYEQMIYDTVGWKGDLFPFTLQMDHMMPLMSHRAHLPPSAHTTFVARDFVVCTFLPRPLEHDDDALKVPFYHQNIDYDEVLFYHDGDFFSRDNLHAGMLSLHPAGFPHGPHPKAVKAVKTKTETTEYAVMIDTRFPLKADENLSKVEVDSYWESWKAK